MKGRSVVVLVLSAVMLGGFSSQARALCSSQSSAAQTLVPLLTGRWSAIGENIGSGGRVASLHQEFMKSETHRRTLLRKRWDRIGVGLVSEGTCNWVTVLFSDGGNIGTTLRAQSC